jgi:hypothetical protein
MRSGSNSADLLTLALAMIVSGLVNLPGAPEKYLAPK